MHNHLGVGWAFPVRTDVRGGTALARQERDIEEAILIILRTSRGSRVMRPAFGCQIHDLIFAPNDATTWSLAEIYVKDALDFWEPRILVQRVRAAIDPDHEGIIRIEVQYEVKATHDKRSLVYPFYRIPGEPPTDF